MKNVYCIWSIFRCIGNELYIYIEQKIFNLRDNEE